MEQKSFFFLDMPKKSIHAQYKDMANDAISLKIFEIIEQNPSTSQQKISKQTGLTGGLVHSFMKRVISKGWVRAKHVSAKRWLYFVTPDGFTEKSRLTINYLSRTLNAYKSTQSMIESKLEYCQQNNWTRIIVVGDNELSNIVALNIRASQNLTLVAVVAERTKDESLEEKNRIPFGKIGDFDYDKLLVCEPTFISWNIQNGEPVADSKILNILPSSIGGETTE